MGRHGVKRIRESGGEEKFADAREGTSETIIV